MSARRLAAFAGLSVLGVLVASIYHPPADPMMGTAVGATAITQLAAQVVDLPLSDAPSQVADADADDVVVAMPPPEPPAPAPEPCAEALAWVSAAGLDLPAGVDYLCPSARFPHHGTACWDDWPCPGSAFIEVNLDLMPDATPEYLRHVVAHEICHILDFRDQGWSTEPRADACAAAYGA